MQWTEPAGKLLVVRGSARRRLGHWRRAARARAGKQIAEDIRRGATVHPPAGIPPLLGYVLATAHSPRDLAQRLRRLAVDYERRARRDVQWLTLYLPAILTIIIGGGAALLEVVSFLGPWFHILHQLGTQQPL